MSVASVPVHVAATSKLNPLVIALERSVYNTRQSEALRLLTSVLQLDRSPLFVVAVLKTSDQEDQESPSAQLDDLLSYLNAAAAVVLPICNKPAIFQDRPYRFASVQYLEPVLVDCHSSLISLPQQLPTSSSDEAVPFTSILCPRSEPVLCPADVTVALDGEGFQLVVHDDACSKVGAAASTNSYTCENDDCDDELNEHFEYNRYGLLREPSIPDSSFTPEHPVDLGECRDAMLKFFKGMEPVSFKLLSTASPLRPVERRLEQEYRSELFGRLHSTGSQNNIMTLSCSPFSGSSTLLRQLASHMSLHYACVFGRENATTLWEWKLVG